MDRRDFLKISSMTALMAAGEWTGLSKVFAQNPSPVKNERIFQSGISDGMESVSYTHLTMPTTERV